MFGLSRLYSFGIAAIAGGLVVMGLLWVGNAYGPNAKWRAMREARDAAVNEVLTAQAEDEDAIGNEEDARFGVEDAAFQKAKLTVEPCVLSDSQAQALNLIGH